MSYIVLSLIWGLIGFTAGYVMGHMAREVHEIKQSVEDALDPERDNDADK